MSVCEMCQYGGDNRRKMTAAEIYSMYIKFRGNDPCGSCVHNPDNKDNFSKATIRSFRNEDR